MRRIFKPAAAMLIATLACATSAVAQEEFYAGKQIDLIVPAGAGGAYGIYALLLTDHLPQHIPGNPTIVPEFMSGAGGMRASNYAANVAPKDGTALYMIHQNTATQQLLASDQAQYDAREFPTIGIITAMNSVMVASDKVGIDEVSDAVEKEVIVGSTGRGSYQFIVPTLLNEFMGTQFNIVTTYTGTADTMLALDRGEIHAFMTSLLSLEESRPKWVEGEDGARVILQVGGSPAPSLPDVPLLISYAQDDTQRAIYQFLSISNAMARSLVAVPGTPDEQVSILRQAFVDLMNDPEFQSAAAELGVPLLWSDGEGLAQVISETLATPAETVELARQYIVDE